jgi:hypothetical protein
MPNGAGMANVALDNTVLADPELPLAANTVTLANAGLYEVEFFMSGIASDTTSSWVFGIFADLAELARCYTPSFQASINQPVSCSCKALVQLTAGQVISLQCLRANGAGNLTLSEDKSMGLIIKKLRD